MAVKAHRIVIEPTSIRGERGQYYRVYFEGTVLIEDTWNPEFEAPAVPLLHAASPAASRPGVPARPIPT
jgi:hypothetical protein